MRKWGRSILIDSVVQVPLFVYAFLHKAWYLEFLISLISVFIIFSGIALYLTYIGLFNGIMDQEDADKLKKLVIKKHNMAYRIYDLLTDMSLMFILMVNGFWFTLIFFGISKIYLEKIRGFYKKKKSGE